VTNLEEEEKKNEHFYKEYCNYINETINTLTKEIIKPILILNEKITDIE
jgi:hypothetical protein